MIDGVDWNEFGKFNTKEICMNIAKNWKAIAISVITAGIAVLTYLGVPQATFCPAVPVPITATTPDK